MSRSIDVRTLDPAVPADLAAIVERASTVVPKLKALADENRLTLCLLLTQGPCTVRQLTDASGLAQTLVSHHLAFLREQGLVTLTPKGRANVYRLCCDELAAPVQLLASLASITPEGVSACCGDAC